MVDVVMVVNPAVVVVVVVMLAPRFMTRSVPLGALLVPGGMTTPGVMVRGSEERRASVAIMGPPMVGPQADVVLTVLLARLVGTPMLMLQRLAGARALIAIDGHIGRGTHSHGGTGRSRSRSGGWGRQRRASGHQGSRRRRRVNLDGVRRGHRFHAGEGRIDVGWIRGPRGKLMASSILFRGTGTSSSKEWRQGW